MEKELMTDKQWKHELRNQYEDWEEVEEMVQDDRKEEALKKIEKVKEKLKKGIED